MSDEETVYSQKTARSMAYSSVNGFREAVPQRISQLQNYSEDDGTYSQKDDNQAELTPANKSHRKQLPQGGAARAQYFDNLCCSDSDEASGSDTDQESSDY